ncbi:MAG: hypothetical protein ACK5PS_08350 [Desulfopila sp.]
MMEKKTITTEIMGAPANIEGGQMFDSRVDEISLIDLVLAFRRQQKVFWAVLIGCTIFGLIIAFLVPATYSFNSTLEIGYDLIDTGKEVVVSPIESPQAVVAKITTVYIPMAQKHFLQQGGENITPNNIPEITASLPTNSMVIVLTSKGQVEKREVFLQMHGWILSQVIRDHKRIFDATQKQYMTALEQEKIKLEQLENPKVFAIRENEQKSRILQAETVLNNLVFEGKMIDVRETNLDDLGKIFDKQIKDLETTLTSSEMTRQDIMNSSSGLDKTLALLTIDNQIEQNRNRLSTVQTRYFEQLANQRSDLEISRNANMRSQEVKKDEIIGLKANLEKLYFDYQQEQAIQKEVVVKVQSRVDQMQESHELALANQSLKKMTSRKLFVIAGFGIGVIFGFLAVFARELMSQVAKRTTGA